MICFIFASGVFGAVLGLGHDNPDPGNQDSGVYSRFTVGPLISWSGFLGITLKPPNALLCINHAQNENLKIAFLYGGLFIYSEPTVGLCFYRMHQQLRL